MSDQELVEPARTRAQENADYARQVVRGRQAKQLLESSFWLKHLAPEILKKIEQLPHETMWRPNSRLKTCEEIALHSSFCGGWENGQRELLKTLRTWIELGQDAERALKNRGIEI